MAIELNNRTKILAGVVVLAAAGAGAWFFLLQDDAPPPRTVVTSAAKAAPKAAEDAGKVSEAPKSAEAAKAGDAPKSADAPKPAADAAKQAAASAPAAAKPAAQAAAKPIPGSPDQLIADVIDASGVKTQFQAISRETLLKAIQGEQAKRQGSDAADVKAVNDMVDRAFEPGKLGAEVAANLKGSFDAERMARFLELLRQPIAVKMTSPAMRNVTPEAMQEFADSSRKSPPPAARVKLINSLDDVTRTSETATELATAIVSNMVDAMLGEMQKAGKNVPKEARQTVGSKLNAMRAQMRAQMRSTLMVAYKNASDQEIADYVKLLDADTGRWGTELVANAARPVLATLGSGLGKEAAQLAMSKRAGAVAAAPAEPAPEPLAKAQTEAPPAAKPADVPAEPVGYRRAANVRELYTRYNDVVSATVMRDGAAVKELLDDGKSPNGRQSDGTTPLMIAVANGDAAIAGMLLAKGADPNRRANGGITALSIAKSRGSAGADMVQLLQRSGARD
jgi:hypothetical protein